MSDERGNMGSPQLVFDAESLLTGLQLVLPGAVDADGGFFVSDAVPLSDGRSVDRLQVNEIVEVLENLKKADIDSLSSLRWDLNAEFSLVSLDARWGFDRFFERNHFVGQGENPVTYAVGRPSVNFVAFLLCVLGQDPAAARRSPRLMIIRRRVRNLVEDGMRSRRIDQLTGDSLLDFVGEVLSVTTLQVSAASGGVDFEGLANSFLFHAAYNLDAAARIGVDSLLEPRSIQRVRRGKGSTLDAPRQSYKVDLVQHYLMGVAAEIPLLEYLSYYHIAEHFFHKVFNDDLVEQVRKGITDPSFSARRSRDVQGIIKTVDRALRQTREEGGFNEPKALQLVMERFVSLPRLIQDLDSYDGTLIEYYATNDVPFAGAGKLALRDTNEGKAHDALAKRIYKVRNALVHAKEGDLPKYAPFTHDAELLKEIPLMRFVAEQVIIEHGKPL
ncbi:hypothetical protein ACFXAE_07545 [Streptomyces sp. NPDC059454]|uniref:hypothetical protein n=1 Tax=Streptomyces sp. NPDC059454 TaxID=3346836 RepID=UPI0036B7E790